MKYVYREETFCAKKDIEIPTDAKILKSNYDAACNYHAYQNIKDDRIHIQWLEPKRKGMEGRCNECGYLTNNEQSDKSRICYAPREIYDNCLLIKSKYTMMPLCNEHNIIDEIKIEPIRQIPYDYAKLEIEKYIQQVENRRIHISELAEELRLDIELIMKIMEELGINND